MTIRELQSLIAEIDCVLAGDSSGSERSKRSTETVAHQAILERVRHYLLSIQERLETPEPADRWQQQTASAIASAVIQQIEGQRSIWMQPWQMELETVRQQRNLLLREIQQLEGQRQQLVGDFLRVLLDRVSEGLRQEMAQTLERIETQAIERQTLVDSEGILPKSPTQRLEQLQQLQVQSDRLLMSLDSTFRQVFGTLERDIQDYERSLSAAIGRIYALGMQDSSMLATHLHDSSNDTRAELPPLQPLEIPPFEPTERQQSEANEVYPFAGLELSSSAATARAERFDAEAFEPIVDIESMNDSEIDALLQLDERQTTANAVQSEEASDDAIREGYPDPWDAPDLKTAHNEAELDRIENKLFGRLGDPAEEKRTDAESESWVAESVRVEAGLFESAAPTPIAAPSAPVEVIATVSTTEQPSPQPLTESEDKSPQPIADTIASLTELLDCAYTDGEAETETYSAVPPGESLIADAEASFRPETSVNKALEDPQLSQRLDEDLQRFGREGTINLSKPPLPEATEVKAAEVELETTDEPPAELFGENLGDIDLDDLWVSEGEELNSSVKSKHGSVLPEEIVTDPWSQPANPTDPEAGNN